MTNVDMCVHMDCQGCERKIRKALQKIEGVQQVEIDLERQKVTVTGWVDQNKALKAVRKTGRKAVLWPYGYSNGDTYTSQQYHPALAQNSMGYRDANPPPPPSSSSSSFSKYGGDYDNSREHRNYGYHYQPQLAPVMYPVKYNIYNHGYGGGHDNISREHGNYGYQYQPQPAPVMYPARVGQRTEDMFSEENPNACLAQNSMGYRDANSSSSKYGGDYDNSHEHRNYGYHYQPQPAPLMYPVKYDIHNHGYGGGYDNSHEHGNYGYQYQPQPAPVMYPARVGQRTEDFSEENPNACFIM